MPSMACCLLSKCRDGRCGSGVAGRRGVGKSERVGDERGGVIPPCVNYKCKNRKREKLKKVIQQNDTEAQQRANSEKYDWCNS